MCQHALLACVCVCVCLCASSWIREAHGNTYCIAVATDPSPFLKMHTHSHTLILISSVINEEHTCVQCTEWESTFIACSRKKTWKEAYQLYHELHTHTHTNPCNRNLHCVSLRNPAVKSARAAGLLHISVWICACETVRSYARVYAYIKLYFDRLCSLPDFYPEILEQA